MNQLFNLENPFWTFLSKCADILILSILWVCFSLPVITVGASTTALYYSVHKTISTNSGYTVRSFWHSFRENLLQGIVLTVLVVFPAAFCAAAWIFSSHLGTSSALGLIYRTAAILAGVLIFSTCAYLFPLLSRFYMKTPDLIRTAFALAVTRAGFTLLLDLVLAVCILGVYLIPASVFVLPATGAFAAERLIEPALARVKQAGESANPSADTSEYRDEPADASDKSASPEDRPDDFV